MKSGNQRPYWAGFLTGAGVTLLAVYVMKQAALVSMDYDLYVLIGIVGLVLVFVGACLHSPLPDRKQQRTGLQPEPLGQFRPGGCHTIALARWGCAATDGRVGLAVGRTRAKNLRGVALGAGRFGRAAMATPLVCRTGFPFQRHSPSVMPGLSLKSIRPITAVRTGVQIRMSLVTPFTTNAEPLPGKILCSAAPRLLSIFGKNQIGSRPARSSRWPQGFRPTLDQLEDRLVPSSVPLHVAGNQLQDSAGHTVVLAA